VKQVQVPTYEHNSIEVLCDQRDTLGRRIAVDGEYDYAFAEEVGEISQDAEGLVLESACSTMKRDGRTLNASIGAKSSASSFEKR
jgi:hypothetical protein